MVGWAGIALLGPFPRMGIFPAFDGVPDPRTDTARHDLCELLVMGFVAVLCFAINCAGMAALGRAKEPVFSGFLKLRHAIPSHDTFSTVFRMIDPKALGAAFGRVLAEGRIRLGNRENAARIRKDVNPANIALLRRRAPDLARRDTSKGSLAIKLKQAGWSDAFLLSLLKQSAGTWSVSGLHGIVAWVDEGVGAFLRGEA